YLTLIYLYFFSFHDSACTEIYTLSLHDALPILKLPFENHYGTPETLGVDRMALIASVYTSYPNKNCLVIDAGSCITYDFINQEGQYKGGAISPGLKIRFKAMHTVTAGLPLVDSFE